eukprot:Lankesteria_metandrocarpae@DN4976_c0_g3_i1.p1
MDTEGVVLSRRLASITQVAEFSRGAQRLRMSLLPKLSPETETEMPSLHLVVFYVPFQKLFQAPRLDARSMRYIGWQATDMKGGVVNLLFYGDCCTMMSKAAPGNLWAARNPKLLPLKNGGEQTSKYGVHERRTFVITAESDILLIGKLSEYRQCIATDSYGRVCGIPVSQDGQRKASARVVPALCGVHITNKQDQETAEDPVPTATANDAHTNSKAVSAAVVSTSSTGAENKDPSNGSSADSVAVGGKRLASAIDVRMKRHVGREKKLNSSSCLEDMGDRFERQVTLCGDVRVALDEIAQSVMSIMTKVRGLVDVDDIELSESDLMVHLEKLKKIQVLGIADGDYALVLFKPFF